MTLVRLPSVILDLVAEDFLDAIAGSVISSSSAPFALVAGTTLDVKVNGGATQPVPFSAPDFHDIGAATAAEVAQVISTWLTGAFAIVEAGKIRISTSTFGTGGSVQVVAQPSGAFGFPTGLSTGSNSTVQTLVINQIPEPSETEVPLAAPIEFDVYCAGGAAPASSTIDATVAGIGVLAGGAALAGWAVAYSTPDSSTRHVKLTPPASYESDSVVVVAVNVGSASSSWSFRTFDTVRPRTLDAVARAKQRIRVTFSEPMRQVDPTAAGDALNTANYLIEHRTRPAVSLSIVSIESVAPGVVDLLTDIEMTYGAGYLLTVSNLLDVAGNLHVVAPDNEVEFDGFVPSFPVGRRFVLTDFVPATNLAEDSTGDLRMMLACMQEVTNVLLSSIDDWVSILDPDFAPEAFVDAMLADLGNPFSFEIAEVDKRRLLRVLVHLYKLKGTAAGVIDSVLFFTGISMTIRNYNRSGWRLGPASSFGPPEKLSTTREHSSAPAFIGPNRRGRFSFRLISPVDLTPVQRELVEQLATYMKAAREHYLGTIEPTPAPQPNHLALGYSRLGGTSERPWKLH